VSRVYWAVFLDNKLFLINISYWKRGYMRVRGCIFYRLFFKTNWSILCLLRWPCWSIGYLIKYEMPFFCTNSIAYIFNSLVDFPFCSYLKQELDLRCAIPLGFYRSALNLGISAGVVFPWGSGFSSMPSPLPERFFLGGNLSPVCTLGGPTSLWGFRTRGLGPTEPRRQFRSNPANENTDSGRDHLGGDLALAVFADFSFDFPSKWLSAKGIHGHFFASAGNVEKLTENAYRNFSLRKFTESFRSSVGVGVVIPTNLFRMEVSNLFLPPIM